MAYALPTQLFDKRQLITNPVELITYEIDAGFDRASRTVFSIRTLLPMSAA